MAQRVNSDERIETLIDILRYRRPDQSYTEAAFINKYLFPLGVLKDEFGNLIKRIGDAPIMWSSHTDTVHDSDGMQKVVYNRKRNEILLPKKSASSCLGADCGTGVWLMIEMIKAGVEGLYIFHRAEEIGGLGSRWITTNTPQIVEGINYAIAFDRFGTNSVITHQCGRGCSDAFAFQLGSKLGGMMPDDTGIYTDTAEYTHLIPECTNVSVGYDHHHTRREFQDVGHAIALLDRLTTADFTDLIVSRDINDEPDYGSYGGFGRQRYVYDDGAYDTWGADDDDQGPDLYNDSYTDLVRKYPQVAAQMIYDLGVSKNMFIEDVFKETGTFEQNEYEDDGTNPL